MVESAVLINPDKSKVRSRRRFRFHPNTREGSNGYEDQSYATERKVLKHGFLDRWINRKRARTELTREEDTIDSLAVPSNELPDSEPVMEVRQGNWMNPAMPNGYHLEVPTPSYLAGVSAICGENVPEYFKRLKGELGRDFMRYLAKTNPYVFFRTTGVKGTKAYFSIIPQEGKSVDDCIMEITLDKRVERHLRAEGEEELVNRYLKIQDPEAKYMLLMFAFVDDRIEITQKDGKYHFVPKKHNTIVGKNMGPDILAEVYSGSFGDDLIADNVLSGASRSTVSENHHMILI